MSPVYVAGFITWLPALPANRGLVRLDEADMTLSLMSPRQISTR